MGVGFVFPEFDLDVNHVQDLGNDSVPLGFSVSCIGTPNGNGGLIIMSATSNSRNLLLKYYDKLKQLSDNQILEIVVKILFLKEENIVFSIDWWDKLDSILKNTVREMFIVNSSFSRSNSDLLREIEFINRNDHFFSDIKIKKIKFIN